MTSAERKAIEAKLWADVYGAEWHRSGSYRDRDTGQPLPVSCVRTEATDAADQAVRDFRRQFPLEG